MRVIAYTCQYTGPNALSTDAQLQIIQAYAQKNHLDIIEIVKDSQHAVDLRQGSGLKKAVTRCQEDPDIGFIIARLDCLTRSLKMLKILMSGALAQINLFSVDEELDTRTKAGRMMLGLLESISQWESDLKNISNDRIQKAKMPEGEQQEWWQVFGNFEGRLFRPEVSDESEFSEDSRSRS